jgi:hypothetical protein
VALDALAVAEFELFVAWVLDVLADEADAVALVAAADWLDEAAVADAAPFAA